MTTGPLAESAVETLDSRPYSEIQVKHVDWTIPGIVPSGMLTVLAGDPKLGKSLLLAAWVSLLSKQAKPSILITAEDAPEYTTKPRLMAAQADEALVHQVYEHPMLGLSDQDRWLHKITNTIEKYCARFLVIDPFTAFMGSESDSYKDQHVRAALSPLRDIAERTQCAIVYVMHLTKGGGTNPLHRIMGSGAFGQVARSVILMTAQETRKEPGRYVAHYSCNVAELAPTQLWNIEKIVLPEIAGRPVHTARLSYVGIAEVDMETLLAPRMEASEVSERELAEQLIEDALAGGPMPSSDLEQLVRQAGVSARTYDRARQKLGVRGRKDGKVWVSELVTKEGRHGKDATEGWRSSFPDNDAGLSGKDARTPIDKSSGVLDGETVSQSPPLWGVDEGWESRS